MFLAHHSILERMATLRLSGVGWYLMAAGSIEVCTFGFAGIEPKALAFGLGLLAVRRTQSASWRLRVLGALHNRKVILMNNRLIPDSADGLASFFGSRHSARPSRAQTGRSVCDKLDRLRATIPETSRPSVESYRAAGRRGSNPQDRPCRPGTPAERTAASRLSIGTFRITRGQSYFVVSHHSAQLFGGSLIRLVL